MKTILLETKQYLASALYIKIACNFVQPAGVSFEDMNRRMSQPVADNLDDNDKLPLNQVLAFWQNAAELAGETAIGIHAGGKAHLNDYGLMSHVLMNCPNVYEALHMIHNYRYLMNEAFESTMNTRDGLTYYTMELTVGHPMSKQLLEYHLATIARLGQAIAAVNARDQVVAQRVDFAHAPSAPIKDYEEVFQCEVRFEQPVSQMIISQDVLLLPTHSPNRGLLEHLTRQLDSIYWKGLNSTIHVHQVCQVLTQAEEKCWPTLEEVAQKLGISTSTLKRRLKEEGSSFQSICDQVRYNTAKHMMVNRKAAVSDTSDALGFSSPAAFSRAFKRWSGMTPSEYLHYQHKTNNTEHHPGQ